MCLGYLVPCLMQHMPSEYDIRLFRLSNVFGISVPCLMQHMHPPGKVICSLSFHNSSLYSDSDCPWRAGVIWRHEVNSNELAKHRLYFTDL